MTLRPLCKEEVSVSLKAEPELVPVQGNAMASGDEHLDKEVEDRILARMESGDVWAWAAVTVNVHWQGMEGSAQLGCCSYDNENDFRQPGGYYDDLVEEALHELNGKVRAVYKALRNRSRSRHN